VTIPAEEEQVRPVPPRRALLAEWWRRREHHRPPEGPDARPITAFVLAGGGSRGAVQVGMLAELADRGITPDRIYGTSVGAINGAAFAGDPTPAGAKRLERVWLGIRGEDVFPRSRVHGPWKFFQTRSAVHPNSGLRRIVDEGLLFDRIEDAPVHVEVVATSLTDGSERWFTHGPAVDVVLASAAIPALLPPVEIDGDLLMDGGVVNNVPISRAIAMGATRIFVLSCGPLRFQPSAPKRPVESVLTALFVSVHARFGRDMALVPPGVEVVVFTGGEEVPDDYRDFTATPGLIKLGRAEVASTLERYRHTSHELQLG